MAFGSLFGNRNNKEQAGAAPAAGGSGIGSGAGGNGTVVGSGPGNGSPRFQPDPQKAEKFFQHARTVQETENYEYAMQLWLNGLRFAPDSMDSLESFFKCAARFLSAPGAKKGPNKDVYNAVADSTEMGKYLRSLLDWGMKPQEAPLALKAMDGAVAMGLVKPGEWIGVRAGGWANDDKNPKRAKDLLLKIAENFAKLGAHDQALVASEAAFKLDPGDSDLAAKIRSLAATATMTKGGYTKSGQEGGFRQNIRDTEKQRQLDDADRIVKTEGATERLVKDAEDMYAARPGDVPTIENLAKRLLERGKPGDEDRALRMYIETYESTKQFRFRELSGDIQLRRQRRKVNELKAMLEKSPGQEMIQRMLESEQETLLSLELDEFKLRVAAYPTDLSKKYELGRRHFLRGEWDSAIAMLQESQLDAKVRVPSLNTLGQAFQRIHYFDEAVQTFRAALELRDMTPEVNMELRYNLMAALMESSRASRDAGTLREAEKLASSIAMQQFGYKDIRARRDEIKKLLTELGA